MGRGTERLFDGALNIVGGALLEPWLDAVDRMGATVALVRKVGRKERPLGGQVTNSPNGKSLFTKTLNPDNRRWARPKSQPAQTNPDLR